MHADAHFVIGGAHVTGGKPCQDYAAAGDFTNGGAYAIVSDGCSSGGRTDIGARLVTLAAVRSMMSPSQPPAIVGLEQAAILARTAEILGLETEDLLATCLYASSHGSNLTLHLHGDGVAAWQYSDGTIDLLRLDWDDNTPSYPAYSADGYAGFVAYHGANLAAQRATGEFWRRATDGSALLLERRRYLLGQVLTGLTIPFDDNPPITRVAVFTDGVTQVDGLDWKEVVGQLMNFKTTAGEFAKRRLNRFVKDSYAVGRGPIDDVAYAVINLVSKEE